MKTRVVNIRDSLPLDIVGATVGDLTVLENGTTYMFYNGCWHEIRLSLEERAQLRKEAGHIYPSERLDDYDRAMRGI